MLQPGSPGSPGAIPDLVESHGFARGTAAFDAVLAAVAPAIRLWTRAARPPLSGSKIGGAPHLPPHVAWPFADGTPLTFIAQVNLADTAPFDLDHLLPHAGRLLFFCGLDHPVPLSGYDLVQDDRGTVVFDESAIHMLEPRHDGPAHPRLTERSLACSLEWTLPPLSSFDGEALAAALGFGGHDSEVRTRYQHLVAALSPRRPRPDGGDGVDESYHRLLGHPQLIQGDLQRPCAARHGGAAGDWRLLLQLDSDFTPPGHPDRAGLAWGDAGAIYYLMRRKDLAARRFEAACFAEQCA